MHNSQHINPAGIPVNHIKNAVVTDSEPVVRVSDPAQPFDTTFALFRGIVQQMFLHGIGNSRGIVFRNASKSAMALRFKRILYVSIAK